MRNWIYWGFATVLLATVVHITIVLFAPVFDVGRKMAQFETVSDLNSLVKIGNDNQTYNLLVEPSPDLIYAFCRFDVSKGPLEIEASIPPDYWSVSVYSNTGDNIYSINDAQTGTRQLKLLIVYAGATGENADTPPYRTQNAIKYVSTARTGLIMFRGFVPDDSLRGIVDDAISSTKCTPVRQQLSDRR